jgi:selenocysteine lyase/cysteine desulfurase
VLYGKREALRSLDVSRLRPAPDTVPERMEKGTQNHEGIVGAAAAVAFLAGLVKEEPITGAPTTTPGLTRRERLELAYDALHRRSCALFRQLWEGLHTLPRIEVFGPPPTALRTPTVSFIVEGISAKGVATALASRGIFASHGNFYAATVAERLGQARDGLVRLGCACYTTAEEIERAIEALRELTRDSS